MEVESGVKEKLQDEIDGKANPRAEADLPERHAAGLSTHSVTTRPRKLPMPSATRQRTRNMRIFRPMANGSYVDVSVAGTFRGHTLVTAIWMPLAALSQP